MSERDRDDSGRKFTHEPGEHPSTAIVSAVATVLGAEPDDLPALYDVVDGDQLDEIVRSDDPLPDTRPVSVSFRYAGCDVTVNAHGRIVVERSESASGEESRADVRGDADAERNEG